MSKVNFCKLTAAQYDSLENKDADTIYFLTDSKTIVLGADKYVSEKKSDKFLVQRVFAHETYGTVAYLDGNNSMDLSGYFADGISQFELWLVSATPEITGNIVLIIGTESFTRRFENPPYVCKRIWLGIKLESHLSYFFFCNWYRTR